MLTRSRFGIVNLKRKMSFNRPSTLSILETYTNRAVSCRNRQTLAIQWEANTENVIDVRWDSSVLVCFQFSIMTKSLKVIHSNPWASAIRSGRRNVSFTCVCHWFQWSKYTYQRASKETNNYLSEVFDSLLVWQCVTVCLVLHTHSIIHSMFMLRLPFSWATANAQQATDQPERVRTIDAFRNTDSQSLTVVHSESQTGYIVRKSKVRNSHSLHWALSLSIASWREHGGCSWWSCFTWPVK